MTHHREIRQLIKSQPVLEGAGVHLKRAFGFSSDPHFADPFLLLDDFRGERPSDFTAGFPWHPHRGIETITYMLTGRVEHGDSMKNKGVIGPGDVQWMTAGSGIIHQEMPKGDEFGRMGGFQLWANLPASRKMMPPRYREVRSAQIPEVTPAAGVRIKVICGEVHGVQGPVRDIVTDPEYLDVALTPHTRYVHPAKSGHTVFAYVFEGQATFSEKQPHPADNGTLVLFGDGGQVTIATGNEPVRFLLISGRPLGEPVAWAGPIVMNTQAELDQAFEEYRTGAFIKHK